MALNIDKDDARRVLRDEAEAPEGTTRFDLAWREKVVKLSELCKVSSQTHIAFLGTAMLAKATNRSADLFAIKPTHAIGNPNAYSARTLCHGVLVPLSAELGFSIGVTGREPLNNQPYFRMTRLDDGTPIHSGSQEAFDFMLGLVREIQVLPNERLARKALRAFIAVRRGYQPSYAQNDGEAQVTPDVLVACIEEFVNENSEGGRRAQAVVAGLMDVVVGESRVESGRINDPSRNNPGDVCVRSVTEGVPWEKAIEVRDKPVSASDIQLFCRKCIQMGARDAAVVAVSDQQTLIDRDALARWANTLGLGLTLFIGWDTFVEQALFWAAEAKPVAASLAVSSIHQRLVAVEVSAEGAARWQSLIGSAGN
jgi:hypothetical protein